MDLILFFQRWVLLLFILVGCTSSSLSPKDEKKIFIYYNNDNFGYLEPCGCRISPIGGMTRRWNAMQRVPVENRLFVDAGNVLFKSDEAPEFLATQWYEQAKGVIDAYNILHADAVAVGETDLALGVKKFDELRAKAKFPFLSANLFKK